ncbi:MAG: FG-GAP-like repeat-containing protein [Candidatus Azobacteroides sp.]|nr:FG-GAP-like repeat-containing protein [Candidatus Azobacteroides sp.]
MKNIDYKLILSAFLLFYSFSGISQTFEAESWTLDTDKSGSTKEYVARDHISLQQGFKYTPSSGNTFSAKVDQRLVFAPTENTYADENGNIVNSATQGAAVVGNLSGTFDVSPTGAATYSVPIEVPPGIQGMQPNISLVYNSQSGNGIAGMCWNIGGLSMISRVPKDYYFDDERSGIIWDKTSPFALDGQRLIVVNNNWGTDSIEYRTESGNDIIRGYIIGRFGPVYFKVYTKDGRILEYGKANEFDYYDENLYGFSYALCPVRLKSQGGMSTDDFSLGWLLNKVTDTNNNYIQYNYTNTVWKKSVNVSGDVYYMGDNRISTIEYGNGNTKVASVHFQYKSKTTSYIQYIDTIETKNQSILDYIEIKGLNNELQDTYQLAYTTQDQNDFLTQITRTNSSGESIQPLKFNWAPMSYPHEYTDIVFDTIPNILTTSFDVAENFIPYSYGDIDGDGLTDILVRFSLKKGTPKNYWAVYRNTGNGFFQYMYHFEWDKDNENSFLFLDIDLDGKDELYVSRVKQEGSSYWFYMNCYKIMPNGKFEAYPSRDIKIQPKNGKEIFDKRNQLFVVPSNFTGKGDAQFIVYSGNNKAEFYYGFDTAPANDIPGAGSGSAKSRIILTNVSHFFLTH